MRPPEPFRQLAALGTALNAVVAASVAGASTVAAIVLAAVAA